MKANRDTGALMSVEQLATRWGVTPRMIRNSIDRGEIIALRFGRIIKISRAHVEALETRGNTHGRQAS